MIFDSLELIDTCTLTGTAEKGIVEVTNCFCVPHKESESQVEADLTYGMDLYDLNHRVNAQENIVGWWATGNEVLLFPFLFFLPQIPCDIYLWICWIK